MPSYIKKLHSRRRFLSHLSLILSLPLSLPLLSSSAHAKTELWQKRLKQIVQDIKPIEGRVSIELPAIATHGNLVPITISVVSPMSEQDYVQSITLISNRNKTPELAEFQFSPLSGKAECSTTLRLEENQEIMALAKMNDGKLYIGRRQAKINIS
ncbi:MAG: thiosulfate oxidation carrier protein SoxY [Methyloligellaceae bacterium]